MSQEDFALTRARLKKDFIFDKENIVSRAQLYGFYATQGLLNFAEQYLKYVDSVSLEDLKNFAKYLFSEKYKKVYIK